MSNKEIFNKIREVHDEIKLHPFWETFDMSLKPEIWNLYRQLQTLFYSLSTDMFIPVYFNEDIQRYYYSNPYAMLIKATTHDFNARFHTITKDNIGNHVVELQSYLSLFHSLIEERGGAVHVFMTDAHYYSTWRAIEDEHGWHICTEIPKSQKNKVIEDLTIRRDKAANNSSLQNTAKYLNSLLKDIEDGTENFIKFV